MSGALRLSDRAPFATGGRRLCFVHPREPSKCVKVLRRDEGRFVKTGRTLVPAALRREYDNNEDERRALAALWRRLGEREYRHLPRCYGYEATDLGRGLVLDLVRDADGRISRSVREALSEGATLEELRPAYEEMASRFIGRGVATRAILEHNLAAQRHADGRFFLVLIDGFGDPAWIPMRSLVPALRRATARKRAARGWERIEAIAEEIRRGAEWDTSRWGQGFLHHRGEAAGESGGGYDGAMSPEKNA
jgi:hypothetical protein